VDCTHTPNTSLPSPRLHWLRALPSRREPDDEHEQTVLVRGVRVGEHDGELLIRIIFNDPNDYLQLWPWLCLRSAYFPDVLLAGPECYFRYLNPPASDLAAEVKLVNVTAGAAMVGPLTQTKVYTNA
jgi:hypothetical protein